MSNSNTTRTILAVTSDIIIEGERNQGHLFATVDCPCNVKEIHADIFGAEMVVTVDSVCRYTGELLDSAIYRMPVSDRFEHCGIEIQIPQVWSVLYWIAAARRVA